MSQKWFTYENGTLFEYDSTAKFPASCIGFIYKITNIKTGKFYIGRKSLYSNTKKKLTKAELAEMLGPGRKPSSKIVTKESNWNPAARNGSHYGIPQMRNVKLKTMDAMTQIDWGLRYIKGRYQTPCKAWAFFKANGYH